MVDWNFPCSPEILQLVKGNMQLFSIDQQRSQALEAHVESCVSFKVTGNDNPSILITFATKSSNAGQVTSSFMKPLIQENLFFPPDFQDDFPVTMQIILLPVYHG
ncbi:unnamed protein product [Lactuca virosa]|uniref:Uncharacterized protein n=1 Tax=Lactuca virosa TaxID=75947 RepID=A0AAU9PU42_9ASTR|nr:unnamed protein product [Lactuca virosa]